MLLRTFYSEYHNYEVNLRVVGRSQLKEDAPDSFASNRTTSPTQAIKKKKKNCSNNTFEMLTE
jgi:hypothetical protein